MYYHYRNRYRQQHQPSSTPSYAKVEDTDGSLKLATRLATLLADPALTQKHKEFVSSIDSFYTKKQYLSPKQFEYFEKIESQYSNTAKQAKTNWNSQFDSAMKETFKICVFYYKNQGQGFFRNIIEKVENDPNYIPTFEEYEKLCNNKYTKRIMAGYKAKSKYEVDQLVTVNDKWLNSRNPMAHAVLFRATVDKTPPHQLSSYQNINGQFVTVTIEKPVYTVWATDEISPVSACAGNKIYTLFSLSSGDIKKSMVYCEERFLTKIKK
jgi:hypothetical protein